MKVIAEERPTSEVCLSIELEPDDLEEYLDRAYRRVVRRATIPGFRKGKAPRRIVEQLFGRGHLLNEALDFLVPEATTKAVQERKLDMIGQPKVELEGLDPVVIKAIVPLRPTVDLGRYHDIRVKQVTVQVTDKQVDDVLKQLQYDLAPWEPVSRPVQLGDLVNLDVNGRTDGHDIANGSGVDYIPVGNAKVPVPGFSEALQGIQAGETKEFIIDVPDDYGDVELAGKPCTFTVSVNEVKEKRMAVLDDEFAKGAGQGFESMDVLTQKVKEDLVSNAERSERRRYEEDIIDQVVNGAAMDLSPLLVDHEIDHQIQEQEDALKQQRLSVEQYLSSVGKTSEELRDELRPVAEGRLKRSLVLQQIANQEQIDVNDDDVQQEIDSLANESGERAGSVRDLFRSDRGRDSMRRVILSRKTVQRLVDIATGKLSGQSSGVKRKTHLKRKTP